MAHVNPARDATNLFPTAPWGGRTIGEIIARLDPRARSCWEPACGPGMLAHGLNDNFPVVFQSDYVQYGAHRIFDFVRAPEDQVPFVADWIVTNPPFDLCEEFVQLAYARARRGVAMLCRLGFLEGQKRHQLLYSDCRYYAVAPFSERLPLVMGCWDPEASSAAAYAWFIWLKPGVGPRVMPPHPYVIDIPPGSCARLSRDSDLQFAAMRAAA
ncbi:MAG: hypothetical protein Q8L59_11180 [Phenylobacterium sp.]|uniref:hypothetical protein n=1 Tax=Phenylobacterium sp. TaxID=1871053 RepID=UPI0027368FBE|nr:hypothetical protein [Phenylobacterium sp.]MDP1642737.1 hypothetical protein [Phenylobacterium sp.]MDP3117215.1 hypothetical protein [Phenylobacterium sp.]